MNDYSNINIKRTLKELNIDVFKLSPNSEKPVYRICEICKIEEIKKFRCVVTFGQVKCQKCSNQLNGKNNAEKISKSNIEWNKCHSPTRLGMKHTEATKKKISQNHVPRIYTDEQRKALSERNVGVKNPFFGKTHSKENLEKMRQIAIKNAKRGKLSNFYGKTFYAKYTSYKRLDGRIVKLKSSWEVKMAEFLDKNKIQWEYEAKVFPISYLYNGEIKNGTYIPDFFVGNEIWEVKGYWRKDAKIKFDTFVKKYDTLKVKILEKEQLKCLGIKL